MQIKSADIGMGGLKGLLEIFRNFKGPVEAVGIAGHGAVLPYHIQTVLDGSGHLFGIVYDDLVVSGDAIPQHCPGKAVQGGKVRPAFPGAGQDQGQGLVPVFLEELHGKNIKEFKLGVSRSGDFSEAVVTKGGVSTKEINPRTLESLKCKGVYFAGEVMDVDALTGGYNLQIAWSTGYAAGLLKHEEGTH